MIKIDRDKVRIARQFERYGTGYRKMPGLLSGMDEIFEEQSQPREWVPFASPKVGDLVRPI